MGFNGVVNEQGPQTARPPISTVVVVVKDLTGTDQYTPFQRVCETSEEKGGRRGCGGTLFFYYTKNFKRMPFDRLAVPVGEPYRLDTRPYLFQEIENHNHFATCPHSDDNQKRRGQWEREQRQAARGPKP